MLLAGVEPDRGVKPMFRLPVPLFEAEAVADRATGPPGTVSEAVAWLEAADEAWRAPTLRVAVPELLTVPDAVRAVLRLREADAAFEADPVADRAPTVREAVAALLAVPVPDTGVMRPSEPVAPFEAEPVADIRIRSAPEAVEAFGPELDRAVVKEREPVAELAEGASPATG